MQFVCVCVCVCVCVLASSVLESSSHSSVTCQSSPERGLKKKRTKNKTRDDLVEDKEVEWKKRRRRRREKKGAGGGWADGVARMKHLHGAGDDRAKPMWRTTGQLWEIRDRQGERQRGKKGGGGREAESNSKQRDHLGNWLQNSAKCNNGNDFHGVFELKDDSARRVTFGLEMLFFFFFFFLAESVL